MICCSTIEDLTVKTRNCTIKMFIIAVSNGHYPDDLFPFCFSWKTVISDIIFNFLCGGANKVETCQVLDKSNWRNKMP